MWSFVLYQCSTLLLVGAYDSTNIVEGSQHGGSLVEDHMLTFASTPYIPYDSMLEEAAALIPQCQKAGVNLRVDSENFKPLDVFIAHPQKAADDYQNATFFFGEHARELISPHTGFRLLQAVCDQGDAKLREKAAGLRNSHGFVVVLNCNPRGRSLVEKGQFCTRENEDGIDLNRNWNVKFEPTEDHGTSPFSEPETEALKKLMTQSNDGKGMFLTVHSGRNAMYSPHAYNTKSLESVTDPDIKQEVSLLDTVRDSYCPYCHVGPAGELEGSALTGTSLDYAFDKLDVPAYAFEAFVDESQDAESSNSCFARFNPATSSKAEEIATNFGCAALSLAEAHLTRTDKHRDDVAWAPSLNSLADRLDGDAKMSMVDVTSGAWRDSKSDTDSIEEAWNRIGKAMDQEKQASNQVALSLAELRKPIGDIVQPIQEQMLKEQQAKVAVGSDANLRTDSNKQP